MDESPWTFEAEIARTGRDGAVVTLVEGGDFALSARNGDIRAGQSHGLFLLDTRFLSQFELRVEGMTIEHLGVAIEDPATATFFGRVDSSLVALRNRAVCRGLTERITVRNHGTVARTVNVSLFVDADFAGLFEVKENHVERVGWYGRNRGRDHIRLGYERDGHIREAIVEFGDGAVVEGHGVTWQVHIEPQGEWSTTVSVSAVVDGSDVPRERSETGAHWESKIPSVDADDPSLVRAVRQAARDLGSLRIFDPEFPERPVVAAGAPWFMAPFGRDSLLTAWMALIVDPDLALGVLETLARFQGTAEVPATEEQPGRILHEMRFGTASSLALGGGHVYYGSVDATPLFVMLLGELRRWGLAPDLAERLMPHADRALTWLLDYGDRDGDGYIEYERATDRGLAHQGWKDSWDGIRYGDGRVAEAPIALCEVQGYAYAAYLARAHFARQAGDDERCREWRERARALRTAFNRDFWLPERGCFAVGLDGDKRPIDSVASNQGHCLWAGIVDEEKAASVAEVLLSDAMFSGWGVRTLASTEPAYNPVSYHCGSVWPHDNALIAAGLVRYGYVDHAHRIMRALLDVADVNGGRLPELFSGIDRREVGVPSAYPTSCEPQAWAAATPLMFLRLLLRIDPWLPQGQIFLAPSLPAWLRRLRVDGIPMGGDRLGVRVEDGTATILGVSDQLHIVQQPRA
ncbi:MAG TPA: glycogen debranching N-terminal domain-containing protein, partial [Candidatus Limnocylindrales bacterium]